jgi:hypothetical protein
VSPYRQLFIFACVLLYAVAMFAAIVWAVGFAREFACLIDRCYRPDISFGIWSFYFMTISGAFAGIALMFILIWPENFSNILAGFNITLFVVLTGIFWHPSHEAHYLFAIVFVAVTANVAILIARRIKII